VLVLAIALLFGVAFAGLGYTLCRAVRSGAEVYAGVYSEEVARQFEDVFLFIPPRRIADLGWALAAVAFTLVFFVAGGVTSSRGFLIGLLFGAVGAGLALRGPEQALRFFKRRRLLRFNRQLGDALISMSNALKAGFSITQAFEVIVKDGEAPIAQEFEVFLQQTRVGVSFSDALNSLEERVGSQDLKLVVAAVEAARKTGGSLTEIFEKIAATIRERLRIENRIRTLTAQGRLQGIVVGFMPVVIALALLIADPGLMIPFLHSSVGALVMFIVVLMIGGGALMIRKIVNIDV